MDTKTFEEKHKGLLPIINNAWNMLDSADDVALTSWYEAINYLLANISNQVQPEVMPKIADLFYNKPIGVLDDNGKNVYEGDEIGLIDSGSQYLIEWDLHSCGYYLKSIDGGENDSPNLLFNEKFTITKENIEARINFTA